jgi:hypothetical protein
MSLLFRPDRVRPNKKIKLNFLFLIVFINDVAFAEFDRNPNFVPDYILPDVVALLRTRKIIVFVGCSSYVMKL